uniref:Beta-1,4-glucuronyltransferase 1 n=1 Tax=Ciona savignyi TaxID=51511 RepID=H2ZCX2_CIOSA
MQLSCAKFRNFVLVIITIQAAAFLAYYSLASNGKKTPNPIIYMSGETLDYSGEYRIVRFYKFKGITSDFNYFDVSLATQCSINHLHHLVELLDRWNGPVSCSVFVPNQDASFADDAINRLRECYPKIDQHVTFHLVYPSTHIGDLSLAGSWLQFSCAELLIKLENYGYQNYDVAGISFPHNALRNAARNGVLTQYVLLVDIDVMPNVGLRTQFIDFANRHSLFTTSVTDMTAYVVPVFEVLAGLEFPKDKNLLLAGVENGSVRPFHNETCWWCHKTEDFDKWKTFPQRDEMNIAFTAEWDKSWEPFYIARRTVPMFDERFKQYGFDRIQQICEMYVAGYTFSVLDNAFLTHHGWKRAGDFYAKKDSDNAQNWILFNYHFKDNLMLKYSTNRTCSPIKPWIPKNKRGALVGGQGFVNSRLNAKQQLKMNIKTL